MTGPPEVHDLLGRSWDEIERSVAEYRGRAEAAVVRWVWCGPDPDLWERREPIAGDERPLRTVDADPGPERRERFALFGYDGQGDIVVARRFTNHWEGRFGGTQRGVVLSESFWIGGVALQFQHERHGTSHHRVLLSTVAHHITDDHGRIIETRRRGRDTWSRTSYTWANDVLAAAVSEQFDRDGALDRRSRLTYERDERGLLRVRWSTEYHRHFPDAVGDTGVAWFRRSVTALRAARRLVDHELPERILRWAQRVAPSEPVYGLGLMWSLDAPELPPALGLGTVRELEAWRAQHRSGMELREYVWNPAEFTCFDPLPAELMGDPPLDDAYALLNQDWELGENEREPATTLRRSAKKLLTTDWSTVLNAAPDFAVFVIADELDDTLNKQLRKTVPTNVQHSIERGR